MFCPFPSRSGSYFEYFSKRSFLYFEIMRESLFLLFLLLLLLLLLLSLSLFLSEKTICSSSLSCPSDSWEKEILWLIFVCWHLDYPPRVSTDSFLAIHKVSFPDDCLERWKGGGLALRSESVQHWILFITTQTCI